MCGHVKECRPLYHKCAALRDRNPFCQESNPSQCTNLNMWNESKWVICNPHFVNPCLKKNKGKKGRSLERWNARQGWCGRRKVGVMRGEDCGEGGNQSAGERGEDPNKRGGREEEEKLGADEKNKWTHSRGGDGGRRRMETDKVLWKKKTWINCKAHTSYNSSSDQGTATPLEYMNSNWLEQEQYIMPSVAPSPPTNPPRRVWVPYT